MKNFVAVIDVQYDFMMPKGILYVNGAEEIIAPMYTYLDSLTKETTLGVLYTADSHIKEQYEESEEAKLFPLHCELMSKGHKTIFNDELFWTGPPKFYLMKDAFDMWNAKIAEVPESGFLAVLEKNRQEVDFIDIIGVALNFCVKQAADGFIERGYKVRLHTSMTRGIDTGKPGDLDARILYADQIANGKVIVVD